jgi:hypothetical protein
MPDFAKLIKAGKDGDPIDEEEMKEQGGKMDDDFDLGNEIKDQLIPLVLEYYLNVIEFDSDDEDEGSDGEGDSGDSSSDDGKKAGAKKRKGSDGSGKGGKGGKGGKKEEKGGKGGKDGKEDCK